MAIAPGRSVASIADQTVPVEVQNNVVPPIHVDGDPWDLPTSEPTQPPSPPPAQMDPNDPNLWKVPETAIGDVLSKLFQVLQSAFVSVITLSTDAALWLFVRIALISFGFSVIAWWISNETWPTIFIQMWTRLVEWVTWLTIIKYTWTSPLGPGWFPAILQTLMTLGAKITKTDVVRLDAATGGFDISFAPGAIADMGFGLFSAIMAMVSIGSGGLLGFFAHALDGSVILSAIVFCFGLGSAAYALAICGYVAVKYWFVMFRALILATLSMFQGMMASRRLSSGGNPFLNGGIVVGVELFVVAVLVGIFGHVIFAFINALGFAAAVQSVMSNDWSSSPFGSWMTFAAQGWGNAIGKAGALVLLDLILTLWAWAMRTVPKIVADYFAGRIGASVGEMRQVFASSPFAGSRMLSYGMSVVEGGAESGVGGAGGAALAPLGGLFRTGAMGAAVGSSSASAGGGFGEVVMGAAKGALLGGPEGAVAGAIGTLISQRFAQPSSKGGGGTIEGSGDGEGVNERTADREEQSSQNETPEASVGVGDARGSSGGTVESADAGALDPEEESSVAQGAASATADSVRQQRRVEIDDVVTEHGGSTGAATQKAPAGSTQRRQVNVETDYVEAMNRAAAAMERGAAAMEQSASGGQSQGRPASTGGGELGLHRSLGDMLVQQALYMSAARPQPTPPHDEPATINIPLGIGSGR